MNPLEWGPWFYGRFFAAHHPFWGYLFASVVALLIALITWMQIKDKYEEHHPKQVEQINEEPPRIGISLGDNVKDNTFKHVETYGFDKAVELKGNAQGNKFGTVIAVSDPISQWREMIIRDAGNPSNVQEDLNWLRQQLVPRWNTLSSGDRKRKKQEFDQVEKKLMEVASDKDKTLTR